MMETDSSDEPGVWYSVVFPFHFIDGSLSSDVCSCKEEEKV